jgi:hypothetical protein
VAAEELPGGFGALYPVLKSLEEAGRVRRGYFVAGLGGSQFAHPGALERLRMLREADVEEPRAVVLAATDPANPYGVALPWPKVESTRPMRAAGAHVAFVDGRLAAWIGKGERELTTFLPEEEPARSAAARALAPALARWAALTGRTAFGWSAESGRPLAESPLAPFLAEAGFVRSGPGFRLASAAPPGPETLAGDEEFLAAFEADAIPKADFHHREHVRLAWLYLRRHGPAEATQRMREGIRRFAAAHGVPGLYHETLTTFWVLAVEAARGAHPEAPDFESFALRHPELLDKGLVRRHYREGTIESERARTEWIAPDRAPLSEPGLAPRG